jgi:hypothetical protein
LAKLDYCERTMTRLSDRDPEVTAADPVEEVGELTYSLRDYYQNFPAESEPSSAGLDGDLRAIFDDLTPVEDQAAVEDPRPASGLIRRLERPLMANVFRWTGHFPEKTRSLMRHLAQRADALQQVYPRQAETEATIGVTILVTSLAMNFVHRGGYFPEAQAPSPPAQAPPADAAPTPEANSSESDSPEGAAPDALALAGQTAATPPA